MELEGAASHALVEIEALAAAAAETRIGPTRRMPVPVSRTGSRVTVTGIEEEANLNSPGTESRARGRSRLAGGPGEDFKLHVSIPL